MPARRPWGFGCDDTAILRKSFVPAVGTKPTTDQEICGGALLVVKGGRFHDSRVPELALMTSKNQFWIGIRPGDQHAQREDALGGNDDARAKIKSARGGSEQ